MNKKKAIFIAGARLSRLSIRQTVEAASQIESYFSRISFDIKTFSSPGDRDRISDIKTSPPDFFTRDLDDSLLDGSIDCAFHSAKDLPYPVRYGLDWFWLPWGEDVRDAIILRKGESLECVVQRYGSVGVSSARREEYCAKFLPSLSLKTIRGNIEERVEKLDRGDYDMIIIASAALKRLGMEDRISSYIPVCDLNPPSGQGRIAITFRKGDIRFVRLRSLFVHPVNFVGAGPGEAALCTMKGMEAVKNSEVCLYDSLVDDELLRYIHPASKTVYVGKRSGKHGMEQPEINAMILDYARQGKKTVRLKGGDPGIFGRLSEEVDAMSDAGMPFRIIPGVTSLSAATTCTGLMLTRRGMSRGFSVVTPMEAGGAYRSVTPEERTCMPIAFFMAVDHARDVAESLIYEGWSEKTSIAAVFGAGKKDGFIVHGSLSDIAEKLKDIKTKLPGILIVGDASSPEFRFAQYGAMSGRKVLLTCGETIMEKAIRTVEMFGGEPVPHSMIRLSPFKCAYIELENLLYEHFDWIIITSPSGAKIFMNILESIRFDLRMLPKIAVTGAGTGDVLTERGIYPDILPLKEKGTDGLISCMKEKMIAGERALRLRSSQAGKSLSLRLVDMGMIVRDYILYDNEPVKKESLPAFDVAFFASASAVDSFIAQWSCEALSAKDILPIGKPTNHAVEKYGLKSLLIPEDESVNGAFMALAAKYVEQEIIEQQGMRI